VFLVRVRRVRRAGIAGCPEEAAESLPPSCGHLITATRTSAVGSGMSHTENWYSEVFCMMWLLNSLRVNEGHPFALGFAQRSWATVCDGMADRVKTSRPEA
jgi:hypothetical protein